jgi:beta-lactamase regulating signal transducer with metallopeptidase domain/5-hydroxyisourate hydrolase-like protein (transthyretin family)
MTNLIQHIFNSGATEILAQSLLHSLWQAALIALLLLLFLKCIPATKNTLRDKIGLCSLLAILLCWLGTLSILNQKPTASKPAPVHATPSSAPISTSTDSAHPLPESGHSTPAPQIAPMVSSPKTPASFSMHTLLFKLWCVGVLLMTVRLFLALSGTGRHRRKALPIEDPALLKRFEKTCGLLGLKRTIVYAVSNTLKNPGVIGMVKPMLLIPTSMLTGFSSSDLEAVVAHELAHIKRHDYLFNLLQMVIESIFFFNPAVWWISHRIRMEREACCDAIAMQATGQTFEYAKLLLNTYAGSPAAVPAFGSSKKADAKERLLRIVQPNQRFDIKIGTVRFTLLLALTTAGIVALAKTSDLAVETVAKILTPKERVEKLQEIASKLPRETKWSPIDKEKSLGKITVSGKFSFPDGSPPPEHANFTVLSSSDMRSSSCGGYVKKDHTFSVEVPNRTTIRVASYVQGYAPYFSKLIRTHAGQSIDNIEIELKPGFTSSIQIVDPAGKPLQGIEVKLIYFLDRNNGWGGIGRSQNKTTDKNGTATFEDGCEHPVKISINAKGFQPMENQDFILKENHPLVITLDKGLTQTFSVTDQATGHPIAGAKFFQHSKLTPTQNMRYGKTDIKWGATDECGILEVDILEPDAEYGLMVTAEGFNRLEVAGFSATNQTKNISMETTRVIRGKITGSLSRLKKTHIDNKLQYGVTYHTYRTNEGGRDWVEGHLVPLNIKDKIGYFEIRDLLGDEITITPKGTEKNAHFDILTAMGKEISINIDNDLTLWKGGGRIVEFNFVTPVGLPKANGTISACYQTPEAKESGSNAWPTININVSNGVGRAAFPSPVYVMLGRTHNLPGYCVEKEDHTKAYQRPIKPDEEPYRLTYTLSPAGGISGRIQRFDDIPPEEMTLDILPILLQPSGRKGRPTPEEIKLINDANRMENKLRLRLPSQNQRTQNGSFSYTSLPTDQTYRIIARSGCTLLVSDPIALTEQQPIQEIVLQASSFKTISGRVLIPDGSPCSNLEVQLDYFVMLNRFRHGYEKSIVYTDKSGHFEFAKINAHPDIEYHLTINNGLGWQPIHSAVEAGSSRTYAMEKGLTLKGRITHHQTGKPIEGATVSAVKLSDFIPLRENGTQTDAEGRFAIDTLAPEEYGFGVWDMEIVSPQTTNQFFTITGGVDEYLELQVKPITNPPTLLQ